MSKKKVASSRSNKKPKIVSGTPAINQTANRANATANSASSDVTSAGNPAPRGKTSTSQATPSPNKDVKTPTTSFKIDKLLHRLAKLWMNLPTQIIGIAAPSIILIILGINPLPHSIPLINFVQQNRVASLVISLVLALITLLAAIISRKPDPQQNESITANQNRVKQDKRWVIATGISTTSFLLSSTFLIIVLIRPPWCSPPFCTYIEQTLPNSINDDHIELGPLGVQSTSFMIPGDPKHYSQGSLPQNIGAVLIDDKTNKSSYRIGLEVHSLQQDRYHIVIEQIDIVIVQVRLSVPHPLNVWTTNSSTSYVTNPYSVTYTGERAGEVLAATSISIPRSLIGLKPGELDQFNIQLSSRVTVDFQFRVQITYSVSNETGVHTLVLPQTFEVVFSTKQNWYEYQLQGGHFMLIKKN